MPNRTIDLGRDPADTVIYQDTYGDTDYYMVTAPRLPLLMLAEQAGVPGPVLALPDALLRVWIEDKYRRDLSPGEHVRFQLSPIGNPINLVGNMLGAIPVGIDDTVQQASGPGSTLAPSERRMSTGPSGLAARSMTRRRACRTTDDIGPASSTGNDNLTLNQTARPVTTAERELGSEETTNPRRETPTAYRQLGRHQAASTAGSARPVKFDPPSAVRGRPERRWAVEAVSTRLDRAAAG